MTETANNGRQTNLEQAVERVRVAALEMRVAADLRRVAAVVFREMAGLGVETPAVTIFFVDEDVDEVHNYYGGPGSGGKHATERDVVVFGDTHAGVIPQGTVTDWLHGTVMTLDGEKSVVEATGWGTGQTTRYRCKSWTPNEGDDSVTNVPFRSGVIGYREKLHRLEFEKEHEQIVKELVRGLDLGFARFQDFQRLERQNRELEIERSLERVRTGVAAMESGDTLESLKDQVLKELQDLEVPCLHVSIQTVDPARGVINDEGDPIPPEVLTSLQAFIDWKRHWSSGTTFVRALDRSFFDRDMSIGIEAGILTEADVNRHSDEHFDRWIVDAYFEQGSLAMNKAMPEPFSDDNIRLLERFTAVFALGYRRHLDLVAAENRARQAEVEQALEKVRTAVARMSGSADLLILLNNVRESLDKLGVTCTHFGINDIDGEHQTATHRSTMWGMKAYVTPLDGMATLFPEWLDSYNSRKTYSRLDTVASFRERSLLVDHWEITAADLQDILDNREDHWVVDVFFDQGSLFMRRLPDEPYSDEEIALLERFTEVFALGYRRYLDLLAAEQQARQAQIDLGVERVRAAAMAMNSSADLPETVATLFREMKRLDLDVPGVGINFVEEAQQRFDVWNVRPNDNIPNTSGNVYQVDDDTICHNHHRDLAQKGMEPVLEAWHSQETTIVERDNNKISRADFARSMGVAEDDPSLDDFISPWRGKWKVCNVPFTYGTIGCHLREITDGQIRILEALAGAIELGYLRYFDLQAAEARTRDVELDRARQHVRAVVSSMKSAEDITRIADVLRDELRDLGVACDEVGINIIDGEDMRTAWTSVHTATDLVPAAAGPASGTSMQVARSITELIRHWQQGPIWNRARSVSNPQDTGWVVDVPFEFGTLAMNRGKSDDEARQFSDDEVAVLQGFAEVVSLGYTRFRDFEKLEDQNQALELANEQIQQANRLKSEFLANMSHELRTPMNAIVGFSKIIQRKASDQLDKRQTSNLDRVLQSAEILMTLINDILDLSKIEAGRLDAQPEHFDMRELLESCVGTVSPLVKKGVELKTHMARDLEPVWSDPSRIRQIVINLLSNACKFTETGEIRVRLRSVDDNRIAISVRDSGIGIPPDKLAQIFEEFRQADGSTTRKYGGTGLGLSISRKLAQMLEGDVTVDSVLGQGSTFTVTLPAQLASSQPMPDDTEPPTLVSGDGAGRIVLSIDDDPDVISLISQELEEDGYQVIGAQRAIDGIEKAQQVKPHAITLDIMMPGMDGWEAITRLKANPETRDIPLIVVSIVDNKELGYRLGADEYLIKPVDRESLGRVLQRYEGRGKEVLVTDDDPVVIDLSRQLLEDDGWTVRSASNGQQALDEIEKKKPDVMLLDLMMPVMDGFETLRRVRENPETKDLPVIVITAKDLAADEMEDLRAKAHRVIEKDGLDRDRILRELREAMSVLRS